MLHRLQLVAALAILVSCALPFSTCTTYRDAQGKTASPLRGDLPPGVTREVTVQRPINSFDLAEPESYVNLLAFLWPLGFVAAFAKWPQARNRHWLRALELLLLIAAAHWFLLYGILGHLAWGFYVAYAALVLYAVTWAIDVWPRLWRRRAQQALPIR